MKTSKVLKALAVAVLFASPMMLTGCGDSLPYDFLAPPDVSSGENAQRIFRYAALDQAQLIDDFDRNVTMSRPTGYLTPWNVRSSD